MKITRTITVSQMKEIDQKASEEFAISSLVLMENAGKEVAARAMKSQPRTVAIVCGKGNNGGDGLVAARYLSEHSVLVHVILMDHLDSLTGDVATNFRVLQKLNIPVLVFGCHLPLNQFDLIIDALLGTGAKGEVTGQYKEAIQEMNASQRPIIAVDVPSGLDADTGHVLGIAVKAKITVTMALPKKGLLEPRAKPFVGRLVTADIGIPKVLLKRYTLA